MAASETLDLGTRRAKADRQGGSIVKSRVVLGVLAVIGFLALSTTVAQAGAGGTPSPLTSFFVCNSINGDAAGQVVDVESNLFGPGQQSVTIGNGTLACAFTRLFRPGTNPPEEISPASGAGDEQLKCYSVAVAKKTSTPGQKPLRYGATDALVGTEEDIQASEIRYICGPAGFLSSP